MFKKWLKQFLAICICVITILLPISHVYAADDESEQTYYEEDDRDGGSKYYISSGKSISKLFDFGIRDVPNLASWIFQFNTYTVIKQYKDNSDKTVYKIYFNTPNLQSIVKNDVTSIVHDGYTDDTYKAEDTEWLVPVGKHALKSNVITKYGFQIPNYTYMGEYPKAVMSTVNIIPDTSKWWQVLWRAIKSFFGKVSFLKAPDADNYKTITYLNNTYTDKSDYILKFFQDYYIPYFENQIPRGTVTQWKDNDRSKKNEGQVRYFTDPEEILELSVLEDVHDAAVEYNWSNRDKYDKASIYYSYFNKYKNGTPVSQLLEKDDTEESRLEESWIYFASLSKYMTEFTAYLNEHPKDALTILYAIYAGCPKTSTSITTLYLGSSIYTKEYLNDENTFGLTENGFTGGRYNDDETSWENAAILGGLFLKWADEKIQARIKEVSTSYMAKKYYAKSVTAKDKNGAVIEDGTYKVYGSKDTITIGKNLAVNLKKPTKVEQQNPHSSTNYYPMLYKDIEWKDEGSLVEIEGTPAGKPKQLKDEKQTETMLIAKEIQFLNVTLEFPIEVTVESTYSVYEESEYKTVHTIDSLGCFTSIFDDNNYFISEQDYLKFMNDISIDKYEYTEDDFVSADLQTVYYTYNENKETIERWNKFHELLAKGAPFKDTDEMEEILYRQCMIETEGEEGTCYSTKYGNKKTTITMVNVYVYSGIWEVTEHTYNWTGKLSEDKAREILYKLQIYCGPYYTEVVSNMIKLMCATAKYEGNYEPSNRATVDDPRVMPYDTATLLATDKVNYKTTDPRVEMYKEHTVGGLVSSFTFKIALGLYVKPQRTMVNLAGRITEFSVLMQQLCNFTLLDSYGLSPVNLWTSAYVALLMGCLALYFIIKTLICVIKLCEKAPSKVLPGFFILALELGIFTALAANPEGVWTTIKNVDNFVINLGERTMFYTVPELQYLYGEADDPSNSESVNSHNMEVTYYLPYLDIWSKYNTGYGILKRQQRITASDGPEITDLEKPLIGNHTIDHWSVLLMDSFLYYGESKSVTNSVYENGKTYNGLKINNNAYRVVDHFLAPRVIIEDAVATETANLVNQVKQAFVDNGWTDTPVNLISDDEFDELLDRHSSDLMWLLHMRMDQINALRNRNNVLFQMTHAGKLKMTVVSNENYNGEFQACFVDLIVKLLNCCLICFLSMIKMLTFMWQWFVFYIFIFKVVLGIGAEHKSLGTVVLETFFPALALMLFGLYTSVILILGMNADGVFGIILEIFLFWLTFQVIRWWHNAGTRTNGARADFFPKTLTWLYILTNLSDRNRRLNTKRLADEAHKDSLYVEDTLTEEEEYDFGKRTEHYFEESGMLKEQYRHNEKYNKVLENWYKFAYNSRNNGRQWTVAEKNAITNFESMDRFKPIVENYQKISNKNKKANKDNDKK